jgi:hypothetical protein
MTLVRDFHQPSHPHMGFVLGLGRLESRREYRVEGREGSHDLGDNDPFAVFPGEKHNPHIVAKNFYVVDVVRICVGDRRIFDCSHQWPLPLGAIRGAHFESVQYSGSAEQIQNNVRYRTYAFSYDLVPISEHSHTSTRRTPASARNTKALAGSPFHIASRGRSLPCTALYLIGFEKHARSNAISCKALQDFAARRISLRLGRPYSLSNPQKNSPLARVDRCEPQAMCSQANSNQTAST